MSVILLIFGIIMFIGLVVVHEWGHFTVARRNGIEVEEFGIGFPPRAFGKRTKGGWLFSINWLPLGGFVKLKGEHDADTSSGSFGAASTWVKAKVMLAGVVMNIVTAYIILIVVALIGMPLILQSVVGRVESHSPAARAGLQAGDEIVAIGPVGKPMTYVHQAGVLPQLTQKYAGKTVRVEINRDGRTKDVTTTLNTKAAVTASEKTQNPKGYLGVFEAGTKQYGWSAPIEAGRFMWQATTLTFQGLGKALQGLGVTAAGYATGNTSEQHHGQTEAASQVSGPVGIFIILKDVSALGINFVLLIIAIISLTLGIMNVLPIPALDGGRLFVMLLYRLFNRPLNERTEELIHGVGFMFLILIFILVTIVDIHRWVL